VSSVKRSGIVEFEVAVHLVGGDVVVALVVLADRLQHGEGADQVGLDERARVVQRVVVVRLRGVVHDRVACVSHQRVDHVGVGDVADHEANAIGPADLQGLLARPA
jgi:hypothetical protein